MHAAPSPFSRMHRSLALLILVACTSDRATTAPPPVVASTATSAASASADAGPFAPFSYPPARRVHVKDTLHGVDVLDPYRWLEDGASAEVVDWMHAEDAFARDRLAKLPLRDALFSRMKELAFQEQQWAPEVFGGRLFHERRAADRERGVVYVRDGDEDHALLDPDTWSDKTLTLGNFWPSWDGKKIVYQVRKKNADAATLRVLDVDRRKVSDVDVIEGAEWPVVNWTPKSDAFYYQWVSPDPAARASRFERAEGRFHKLGDTQEKDRVVRAPVVGQLGCPLALDSRGRWLTSSVNRGWGKNDVYFQDLRDARPEWRTLVEGRDAAFEVEAYKDVLYVHTTDGAPRGEIFAVDPRRPERAAWKRIVPQQSATLTGLQVIGGRLVVRYLEDVVTRIEVRETGGAFVRAMPTRMGEHTWMSGTADADEAYYAVHSYDRPREIYKASIKSGVETVWHRHRAPVDFDKMIVEQVFFASKDGTRIPMFVFRRKDVARDGSAPLLLSGYGAANALSQPNYSPLLVPWVERGGVYAWPSLRGGGEYGEAWHLAGNLRNKQHTFDDFIAAAEYLVAERYTSRERLAIRGASWGGLLVTAALTQRPDLFRAVIALVPQTDMIRFPLTGLGKTPLAEFGDPANPDDFRALFAYSPYHHVTMGTRYPAVLVGAAESDERVDALHARKLAGALQAASTGAEVILRVDWGGGHMGSGLVTPEAEKRAEEYAFALAAMSITR